MNTTVKVLLIHLAVVAGITLFLMLSFGGISSDFSMELGLVCLAVAALDLFLALILFLVGKENYEIAKGFLLSSGILFLIGFAACSFTTFSFH